MVCNSWSWTGSTDFPSGCMIMADSQEDQHIMNSGVYVRNIYWAQVNSGRHLARAIARAKYQLQFTRARWVLILEKCKKKASCSCFASTRNCSACTVVRFGRSRIGLLINRFPPVFVNSQNTAREQTEDSWANGLRCRFALWWSLCNFHHSFFSFKN